MIDPRISIPSPEVNAALGDLVRAAGKFALATALQYKAERPEDYAGMAEVVNKGLGATVIVVQLSGTKVAQLCCDVGDERRIIVSVPAHEPTVN